MSTNRNLAKFGLMILNNRTYKVKI